MNDIYPTKDNLTIEIQEEVYDNISRNLLVIKELLMSTHIAGQRCTEGHLLLNFNCIYGT